MIFSRLFLLFLYVGLSIPSVASIIDSTFVVSVKSGDSQSPISQASIRLFVKGKVITGFTDKKGRMSYHGNYTLLDSLRVTMIGYQTFTHFCHGESRVDIALSSENKSLPEVYVTAHEVNTLQSTSVITHEALTHIQPSSFADILSLLPGHRSVDPDLSSIKSIRLRAASDGGNNYATLSLGTAFVMDGAVLSTHANRQTISGNVWKRDGLEGAGRGIDMRSIPTDDIQQVEIIRGVPSVKYGNIVSGVVNIKRSIGEPILTVRLKSDLRTTLFAVSKGWRSTMHEYGTSIGYLISDADPRVPFQSYRRMNASFRHKAWLKRGGASALVLRQYLDFSTTIDNIKQDPDINVNPDDRFYSRNSNVSLSQKLILTSDEKALRRFEIGLDASVAPQQLKQTETIISSSPLSVVTDRTTGEHQGTFLPRFFLRKTKVDGLPVVMSACMSSTWNVLKNTELLAGMEMKFEKNMGRGEWLGSVNAQGIKPRREGMPFRNFPSLNMASAYLEVTQAMPLPFQMMLKAAYGLRVQSLMWLGKAYDINNKPYVDPRLNLQITLPSLGRDNQGYQSSVFFSAGLLTLMPPSAYLFSDPIYYDISELQYVNENEGVMMSRYKTYVFDGINYGIVPARNYKWEFRYSASWHGWNLSVAYFHELMTNGFRASSAVYPISYMRYLYDKPDNSFHAEPIQTLALIQTTENGSTTQNQGIELTAHSRRFSPLGLRLSLNGGWFRTIYSNSKDIKEQPGGIVNGKPVGEIGIYSHEEKRCTSFFNTTYLADAWIPSIALSVSLAMETQWFFHETNTYPDRVPTAYIDTTGKIRPYVKEYMNDSRLSQLVRQNSPYFEPGLNIPFSTDINLKASKAFFGKQLMIALFVNKIWSYSPDYDNNGVTIRRVRKPYFGIEINYRLGKRGSIAPVV